MSNPNYDDKSSENRFFAARLGSLRFRSNRGQGGNDEIPHKTVAHRARYLEHSRKLRIQTGNPPLLQGSQK